MNLKEMFNWNHPLLCKMNPHILDWIILFNIICVNILAVISAVAVIIADTSIQGALVIDQTKSAWLSLIFLISVGATVPFAAWAAEYFGYKRTLFAGVAIFIIGATLAGISDHFTEMMIYRVISGIGAGAIFPLSISIISRTFEGSKQTLALSLYIAMAFGLGFALGFFFGGYFTEFVSWRWIFFINLALGPINLLLTWLMQMETEPNKAHKFDISGYLFFLFFLSSVVIIINNAKAPWNTQGWTSTFILSLISLALISLCLFLHFEKKTDHPVFALNLFQIRSFSLGCIAIFFVGSLLFGTPTAIRPMLEHDFLYSKSKMGLILVPFGLSFGFIGSISGYIAKVINIRLLALIGIVITAISCYLNHYITIQSDHVQLVSLFVLRGFGLGLALGPLTALALSQVPSELISQASVTVTIFRQVGGAMGGSFLILVQTVRQVFHTQRFGEQVDIESTRYREMFNHWTTHIITTTGAESSEAKRQARLLIIENIAQQSSIVALNDGLFILGHILLILAAIIIFTMLLEKHSKKVHS